MITCLVGMALYIPRTLPAQLLFVINTVFFTAIQVDMQEETYIVYTKYVGADTFQQD